jgi:hypothetical protein
MAEVQNFHNFSMIFNLYFAKFLLLAFNIWVKTAAICPSVGTLLQNHVRAVPLSF